MLVLLPFSCSFYCHSTTLSTVLSTVHSTAHSTAILLHRLLSMLLPFNCPFNCHSSTLSTVLATASLLHLLLSILRSILMPFFCPSTVHSSAHATAILRLRSLLSFYCSLFILRQFYYTFYWPALLQAILVLLLLSFILPFNSIRACRQNILKSHGNRLWVALRPDCKAFCGLNYALSFRLAQASHAAMSPEPNEQ